MSLQQCGHVPATAGNAYKVHQVGATSYEVWVRFKQHQNGSTTLGLVSAQLQSGVLTVSYQWQHDSADTVTSTVLCSKQGDIALPTGATSLVVQVQDPCGSHGVGIVSQDEDELWDGFLEASFGSACQG